MDMVSGGGDKKPPKDPDPNPNPNPDPKRDSEPPLVDREWWDDQYEPEGCDNFCPDDGQGFFEDAGNSLDPAAIGELLDRAIAGVRNMRNPKTPSVPAYIPREPTERVPGLRPPYIIE